MTPPPEKPGLTREDVERPEIEEFMRLCADTSSPWGMADSDVVDLCKYALHLESLLSPLTGRGAWQPIETAPTDGQHILVAVGDNPGFVSEAYYEEDGSRGWFQANTHWTDAHDGSLFPVIAWQPLPAPPSSSTGGDAEIQEPHGGGLRTTRPKSNYPEFPDSSPWIAWSGDGLCPVAHGTPVTLKFRGGDEHPTTTPQFYYWFYDNREQLCSDIIAYRLLPPSEGAPT